MSIVILVYEKKFFREFLKVLLVPLLSNIHVNDIFFFVDEAFLSNYADDTALYSVHKSHIVNQSIFKKNSMNLKKRFHDNYIVFNPGKHYYMTFGLSNTKNELFLEDGTIVP